MTTGEAMSVAHADVDGRRYTSLVLSGPWSSEAEARFRSANCDGLEWRWHPRGRVRPLPSLLAELPLRSLRLNMRNVDDGLVQQMHRLEHLSCLSRGKNPLDLGGLRDLRVLAVDDRDGLIGLEASAELRHLTLYGSSRDHLGIIKGNLRLLRLRLHGRGQVLDVGGLALPRLQQVSLDDVVLRLSSTIRLPALEGLNVDSYKHKLSRIALDVSALVNCKLLRGMHFRGPYDLSGNEDLAAAVPSSKVTLGGGAALLGAAATSK